MAERQEDTRVKRTREAIVASFNRLMFQGGFDSISVADVIAGAGVGRSTFYEHFRNIDDLLRASASWLLAILADSVLDPPVHGQEERLRHVVKHIREAGKPARLLLSDPGLTQMTQELGDLVLERLEQMRRAGAPPLALPAPLVAAQVAGAQLALLRGWIGSHYVCDPGEIAAGMTRASRGVVEGLKGCKRESRVVRPPH